MSKPTARDLEALMELFDSSDWKELDLRMEGFEFYLSKDPARRPASTAAAAGGGGAGRSSAPSTGAASERARGGDPAPHLNPVHAAEGDRRAVPANWIAVKAPNLGTFYRAPKPGAAPYVELGQHVTEDTEVCLIEVMKLFTSVRAGIPGVVRKLVVQDGEMVEHEQVLLYIEPG